jgi:hypothetical protein
MKKIFIILCCFGILPAHATEMCARNDTVVIPLDATIVSKSGGGDSVEGLWWLNFDYGTIYGASSCLSKKELMMYSDWNGTSSFYIALNTSSDELAGAFGYYKNADTNPDIPDEEKPDYKRTYCTCKIMHPLTTKWRVIGNNSTSCWGMYACYWSCMEAFGRGHDNVSNRNALFGTIGIVPPWEEE